MDAARLGYGVLMPVRVNDHKRRILTCIPNKDFSPTLKHRHGGWWQTIYPPSIAVRKLQKGSQKGERFEIIGLVSDSSPCCFNAQKTQAGVNTPHQF